jgi:mRNA interferase MazF
VKRGEVWWANLPAPAGRRPVLLLSRNAAYTVRSLVTVAPITRTVRGIPAEVPLGPADGLPQPCVVNCDSITTIPKDLLAERIVLLRPARLGAINAAV